ncbi:MAG: hypothetical protein ACYC3L_10855 [Gemmatimonadaceae bacterium]
MSALYEHRSAPLLSLRLFWRRMARHGGAAALIILVSLFGGMAGYHQLGPMPWVDAFLNAAMILGGMGPVDPMTTSAGKLFSGLYALYSGVVFLLVAGILVAPVFHRMLHRFHLEREDRKS